MVTPRTRSRVAAVVALLLLTVAPSCAARSDKAGGPVPAGAHRLHLVNPRNRMELQPFLDAVSTVSAGRLVVDSQDRFEVDTVQGEADAIRLVQSGRADLALIPTRAFDAFKVTSFDALTAPLEVDSLALQSAVLDSEIAADMLAGVGTISLVGVGILPGPIRLPAGITRPLITPSDYRGAKIGVSASELSERSLRALDAVPVQTPFEGADISAFDGIEQQAASISSNQYDGVVRWVTANVGLWPRPLAVVANQRSFAALTETERGWLREAARSSIAPTTALQQSTEGAAAMCRRGRVRILLATPAEISELRRAWAPIYRQLSGDATTADLLHRIDQTKAFQDPDPAEILDCSRIAALKTPSSQSTSAPSPAFDGNYLEHLSEEEAEALEGGPVFPENWGEFRLVLRDGRYLVTQHNSRACTWAYGSFLVSDGRLDLVVRDGGGRAPTHAANKPGETFTYHASLYRGTLRFSVVPDAVSPPGWPYKPWLRQPDRSARSFVDLRCHPPEAAFPP